MSNLAGRYVFVFGKSGYEPWELSRVESFKTNLKKVVMAMGIPTKSSQASQIFDMQGPVRTFSISFTRMDWEQDICNWDFMFSKDFTMNGKRYYGLDWYTSELQTTRPYKLQIYWDGGLQWEPDPKQIRVGKWNVSVTKVSFDIDPALPGQWRFNLDLTQRRA